MSEIRIAGRELRDATCQLPVESEETTYWDSTLQATYDALVLDAMCRQSLATVRSLGSRGLRVAVAGITGKEPTFSSRWSQQAFICPVEEGTDEYLRYLEQILDRTA